MQILQLLDELGKLTIKDKEILSKLEERKTNQRNEIGWLTSMIATLKKDASTIDATFSAKRKELDQLIMDQTVIDAKNKAKAAELQEREDNIHKKTSELVQIEATLTKDRKELDDLSAKLEINQQGIYNQQAEIVKEKEKLADAIKDAVKLQVSWEQKMAIADARQLEVDNIKAQEEKALYDLKWQFDRIEKERAILDAQKQENDQTAKDLLARAGELKAREEGMKSDELRIWKLRIEIQQEQAELKKAQDQWALDKKQLDANLFDFRRDRAFWYNEQQKFILMIKEKWVNKQILDDYFKSWEEKKPKE